jgi:hypothetical protein
MHTFGDIIHKIMAFGEKKGYGRRVFGKKICLYQIFFVTLQAV